MKIKFFKKEKSFKKKSEEINPASYWSFIFCTGFFLTLTAFIFGFYLFKEINTKLVLTPADIGEQVGTAKKERIDKILEYFSARAKRSNQILNSPSPVVDPSL